MNGLIITYDNSLAILDPNPDGTCEYRTLDGLMDKIHQELAIQGTPTANRIEAIKTQQLDHSKQGELRTLIERRTTRIFRLVLLGAVCCFGVAFTVIGCGCPLVAMLIPLIAGVLSPVLIGGGGAAYYHCQMDLDNFAQRRDAERKILLDKELIFKKLITKYSYKDPRNVVQYDNIVRYDLLAARFSNAHVNKHDQSVRYAQFEKLIGIYTLSKLNRIESLAEDIIQSAFQKYVLKFPALLSPEGTFTPLGGASVPLEGSAPYSETV